VPRWPESLYGREVLRIAHHLEGKTGREDQDQTLRRIRDQILQITAPAGQTPETMPVSPSMGHRPQSPDQSAGLALALGRARRTGTNEEALDELLPADSAITTDREHFLNRLANSLVPTAEEKQDILQSYPSLSPDRVGELLTIFKEEQKGFELLLEQFPDGVFDPFHQRVPEWGGIVLGDENAGWRRYLYAPLKGESLFAHAEV